MPSPIVYDITHLLHRLPNGAPSGIDHVDLLFAQFALQNCDQTASVLRYGLIGPTLYTPEHGRAILRDVERARREFDAVAADLAFGRLRAALMANDQSGPFQTASRRRPMAEIARLRALRIIRKLPMRAAHAPTGAVYLNIAQHALEFGFFLDWLGQRPDVKPVFFLHDLLPLDRPEFWPDGYRKRFDRRVETMFRWAKAFIVSTASVARRLEEELEARGKARPPIHIAPLPSPLATNDTARFVDPALAERPYFVVVGTIEPRKNHPLLLDVWRSLAERGGAIPKLVVVGARGWESEQTLDTLDRSTLLRPHVLEVSGLSPDGLRTLIVNARAVLGPSFAEGYGLPIVEALSLGTPVVCSDLEVFRDISQGKARFLSPLDGLGWRETVLSLVGDNAEYNEAKAMASAYRPPNREDYFRGVLEFLNTF